MHRLPYHPPLAWAPLLAFLGARAAAPVEQAGDGTYQRTAALAARRGWLRVDREPGARALRVTLSESLGAVAPEVLQRLHALFDLGARPAAIRRALGADRRLAPLVERAPGLRVAGAFDGFELLLRAILGQQISVRAATTIAGRFAERFGEPVEVPGGGLTRLTPTAARVAEATVPELRALGLTGRRADTIQRVARSCAEGAMDLAMGADVGQLRQVLLAIPGVGPWTVEYVAMRALGSPDAFPHTDLVLMRLLGSVRRRELEAIADRWRPWRSYAAFHLWHSAV
jgi:AraC family transcriptional regulator, regulatory protein of adaptative response / DNA-3-methyladenine glycosylase II